MSALEAACARAISWKLRYFPVPTIRRDLKARPAITKSSDMGNLKRILDPKRLPDKPEAEPGGRYRAPDPVNTSPCMGCKQSAAGSANVRAQEPAQVDADAERIAIQLKRDAAAKVEFEVQVAERFVINTGVEAVVTHEIRGARGNTGAGEVLAVCRLATG